MGTHKALTKHGFTIVELVVVIAVIGILAAITIVAYRGLQEDARKSGALAFASQLDDRHLATAAGVWRFEECSGTTTKSEGAHSITTTVGGSEPIAFSTDTPTGKGCSLQLGGSTFLQTTTPLASSPNYNYYLKSAWIKITSCSRNNNIISNYGSSSNGAPFYIPSTNSCRINAGHNNAFGMITSVTPVEINRWTHVAVEFDTNTLRMYIDGKLDREATGISAVATPLPDGANIGSYGTGNTFAGLMDDVIISNKRPR